MSDMVFIIRVSIDDFHKRQKGLLGSTGIVRWFVGNNHIELCKQFQCLTLKYYENYLLQGFYCYNLANWPSLSDDLLSYNLDTFCSAIKHYGKNMRKFFIFQHVNTQFLGLRGYPRNKAGNPIICNLSRKNLKIL